MPTTANSQFQMFGERVKEYILLKSVLEMLFADQSRFSSVIK